ncbi:conserved hypothetical protein [Roseiflexus castenholzii DSM 13941]|uniref:Nucleotidyltransferase family protein n=2 Tax=Roseiflexus castenholzii TaxID=120962 RepID=A7NFP2_ROSCS|nr:conserved hypothetical protein [Roseiflexus castenholzii DSM 13941]
MPVDTLYDDARRLIAAADGAGLSLRLLGGIAIYHLCPTARHPDFERSYKDIDMVGLARERATLQRLFIDHGYEPDREFNLLHGMQRLIFRHTADERHIDVFLDRFQMCHTFDLRDRLHLHPATLTPADLLLTKLQVVEATENDLRDLFALLSDLPLGAEPGAIDVAYIAQLAARDWGLYRTLALSLDRLDRWTVGRPVYGAYRVSSQIAVLRETIEAQPKTMAWKMRARIGDRVRWYDIPDEGG